MQLDQRLKELDFLREESEIVWILRDEATDFMSSLVSGVYACHHVRPSKDGNLGAGGGGEGVCNKPRIKLL